MAARTLPPDTTLGTVHLRVADLPGCMSFYEQVLGFQVLAEDGVTAALAARFGRPLLVLHSAPHAPARPTTATGLYHVAFLLPSRAALAGMVRRIREHEWEIDGYADHNVSEAVYLADPEGNGIELYADRSPEVWRLVDGEVFITTEPLDLDGLLRAAAAPLPSLPGETRVGHLHMRVASLKEAEDFYVDGLGFGISTRNIPGALFAAAGGYHHHLGFNVWAGQDGNPRPQGSLGLFSFEVLVPDKSVREDILGGPRDGIVLDPDHISVRITGP